MPTAFPLVVAILHSDEDDIDYQLYGAAYGIEMQISGDWHAEAVLLAPHDHLDAVTKRTGVTTEEDSIVSAGVTDIPISEDGVPNLAVIKHPRNNWLLVGDPRRTDTDELIAKKFRAALDADCRIIICVTDTTKPHLNARLSGLASIDCSRIAIALVNSHATNRDIAVNAAMSIREFVKSIDGHGNPRFIVGGHVNESNARDITAMDGVNGVILMDDKYDHWGTILGVLESIGG
jgi:hypothetical protein